MKNHRAFTLIEALIAISIITLVAVGPLSAAAGSYAAALDANNRFTAAYLAQEGLEYVRMLRSSSYVADENANAPDLSQTAFWNDFVNNDNTEGVTANYSVYDCQGNPYDGITRTEDSHKGGDGSKACALDTSLGLGVDAVGGSTKALRVCSGVDSCPSLYFDNGEYKLSGTNPSIFTRKVQFYNFGGEETNKGIEVVVTVSWTAKGSTKSLSLSTVLTPWQ